MSGLDVLAEEALELVDGDQSLTPGCLHGVDCCHDSAVDRGDADAEGLRGLFAGVGQALDAARLVKLDTSGRRALRSGDLMPSCSLAFSLASCAHFDDVH